MTAKAMQRQITRLAKELGCVVEQRANLEGMMYVEEEPPRITGPLIEEGHTQRSYPSTEACYLVLLHELGHVAHGHTQGRPPFENKTFYFDNGVLNSEAEAWEWALDESKLKEYDPNTVSFMHDRCIGSYHSSALFVGLDTPRQQLWNGGRHHVLFAYGSDKTTQAVKKRMKELLS